MDANWTEIDEQIKTELLDEIKAKPVLKRPDPNRRFYLKTDWSKVGKAAVLLQADPASDEAQQAEAAEVQGGACQFDATLSNKALRLLPIMFISQRNTKQEESLHSYPGEARTGNWAMHKLKRWLFGP